MFKYLQLGDICLSGVHGCVKAISLGNTGNLFPFHLDSSFPGAGNELCYEA